MGRKYQSLERFRIAKFWGSVLLGPNQGCMVG